MAVDTTETTVRHPAAGVAEAPVGRSTGWWGMVLFIATEAATFAAFLASYFYLRFADGGPWPPATDVPPKLPLPIAATVVLVLSCLPAATAVRAAGHAESPRRPGLAAFAVLITLAGGGAFVVLQLLDWYDEWKRSTLSENAYGSLFYVITGLHTLHVVVGLGMLAFLLATAAVRGLRAEPVRLVALYWYFMAVVALAVFVTVYLSPYL